MLCGPLTAFPLPVALHLPGPKNHLQFLAAMWLPEVPQTQVSVIQEPVEGMDRAAECPSGDHLPLVLLHVHSIVSRGPIWWERGEAAPHLCGAGIRWPPVH